MPVEIDLIRHGETEGNAAAVWQGQSDTPLTARGVSQARRLAGRVHGRTYAAVVSSDLGRAMATAAEAGLKAEPDPAWREADVGAWEGLSHREVIASHPDTVDALEAGEDVRFGGGETYSELQERALEAVDKLAARLDDGQRAAVVTHGGVVAALAADALGLGRNERRRALSGLANASITTIRVGEDRPALAVLNDTAHLDGDTPAREGRVVTLVRHGETEANVDGRWQGITDGDLTERGARQAAAIAGELGGLAAVYTSPLRRARRTARAIADAHGLTVEEHPALVEMHFGEWEDLAPAVISARWPDEWRRIYIEGNDLPRGISGESYGQVAARMDAAIRELAERHGDDAIGVVGHGGAIRAYVTSVVALPFAERRRLDQPRNTARCRVLLGDTGARLVDYNVAPHLDR